MTTFDELSKDAQEDLLWEAGLYEEEEEEEYLQENVFAGITDEFYGMTEEEIEEVLREGFRRAHAKGEEDDSTDK